MPNELDGLLQKVFSGNILTPSDLDPNQPKTSLSDIGYEDNQEYSLVLDKKEQNSFTKRGIQPSIDNFDYSEDLRAQAQPWSHKLANGVVKFVGKTGTAVLGATVGTLVGLSNMAQGKSFFDNDFQRSLDTANEWMDDTFKHYYTKAEEEESLIKNLGRANFWFNDVAGGLSFTAGAVLTELGLSAATAATFGATAPIQATSTLSYLARAKQILKAYRDLNRANKISKGLNLSRQIITGAGYEAGVEARHYKDEALNAYKNKFKEEQGRDATEEELTEVNDSINKTANGVFAANMALVGYGNALMFPKLFGVKSAVKPKINLLGNTLTGTAEASTKAAASTAEKVLTGTYHALKNPLYEGFVEEGGQSVLSKTGTDYVLSKFNTDGTQNAVDIIDSFHSGLEETYGTKEGMKEALIGLIIGAIGLPGIGGKSIAAVDAVKEANAKRDNFNLESEKQKERFNSVSFDTIKNQIQAHAALHESEANTFEESDASFAFLESREKVGLLGETIDEFSSYINGMTDAEFASDLGYDNLSSEEIQAQKTKTISEFKNMAKTFGETSALTKNLTEDTMLASAINYNLFKVAYSDKETDSLLDTLQTELKDTPTKFLKNYFRVLGKLGGNNKTINSLNRKIKAISDIDKALKVFDPKYSSTLKDEELKVYSAKVKEKESILKEIKKELTELQKIDKNSLEAKKYNFDPLEIDEFIDNISNIIEIRDRIKDEKTSNPIKENLLKNTLEKVIQNEKSRIDAINNYNNLLTSQGQKKLKELENENTIKLLERLEYNTEDTLLQQEFSKVKMQYITALYPNLTEEARQRLIDDVTGKTKSGTKDDPDEPEQTNVFIKPAISSHSNITKIIFKDEAVEQWLIAQNKSDVSTSISLQMIDYPEQGTPITTKDDSRISLIQGLRNTPGKSLELYLDISKFEIPPEFSKYVTNDKLLLGGILDPRRFNYNGIELDITDPKIMSEVNPDLVIFDETGVKFSPAGEKLVEEYKTLSRLFEEYIDGKTEVDQEIIKNLWVTWNVFHTKIEGPKKTILESFDPDLNGITPIKGKKEKRREAKKGIYIASREFNKVFRIVKQDDGTILKEEVVGEDASIFKKWLQFGINKDVYKLHTESFELSQYSAFVNVNGVLKLVDITFPENSEETTELDFDTFFEELSKIDTSKEKNIFVPLTSEGSEVGMLFSKATKKEGEEKLKVKIFINGSPKINEKAVEGNVLSANVKFKYGPEEITKKIWFNEIFYHEGKTYYYQNKKGEKSLYDQILDPVTKKVNNDIRAKVFKAQIDVFNQGKESNIKILETNDFKTAFATAINNYDILEEKVSGNDFKLIKEIDKNPENIGEFMVGIDIKVTLSLTSNSKAKKENPKEPSAEDLKPKVPIQNQTLIDNIYTWYKKLEKNPNDVFSLTSLVNTLNDKDIDLEKIKTDLKSKYNVSLDNILKLLTEIEKNASKTNLTPTEPITPTGTGLTAEEETLLNQAYGIVSSAGINYLDQKEIDQLDKLTQKSSNINFKDWVQEQSNLYNAKINNPSNTGGFQLYNNIDSLINSGEIIYTDESGNLCS